MICIAEVYHSLCRAGTEGVPEAGGAEWGFFGALLAGGESFPEEVFTGSFAVTLGKR